MPPPRKKDRLRGSLSPVREQFTPTGTLYGGQAGLPGKSRPDEGAKTAPGGGAGDCAQTAPMGERRAMGVSGAGKHHTGHPPGQRARPGAKTVPGRGPGTVCRLRPWGNSGQWEVSGAGKAPHWAPAGAEGMPGRKNSPRRGPEAVWMRDMGVTCPGRSV